MSGKMLAPEIRFGLIARAVVLVLLLGGIKVAMMLTMSSHLFQTHYRLQGNLSGPVMIGTGCLFIGLLMASFIQLGRQSPVYAVRDIRWFNVWFVIAGLAFTFFSLHQGPNNYIQPVLDGTLRWQAVGWYLANNFPDTVQNAISNGALPLSSKSIDGVSVSYLPVEGVEGDMKLLLTNQWGVAALQMYQGAPERFLLYPGLT